MAGPQLEMIRDSLDDLPPIPEVEGYTLRTMRMFGASSVADEEGWCACFAQWTAGPHETYTEAGWTPEKLRGWFAMEGGSGIEHPANLFLVECDADQSIVATACCWTTPNHEPGMGELGWVASVDGHRGKGLGNLVTIAVLHRLKLLGKKTARLNTDDWRVPVSVTPTTTTPHHHPPPHTHLPHPPPLSGLTHAAWCRYRPSKPTSRWGSAHPTSTRATRRAGRPWRSSSNRARSRPTSPPAGPSSRSSSEQDQMWSRTRLS